MVELFWFPSPATPPVLTDPSAPISQVSTRIGDDRLDATLGLDQPIVEVHGVRLRLAASGWMSFRQGGPLTYHLLTLDGTFGLPLAYRHEAWTFEGGWRHTSAHLADGTRLDTDDARAPSTYSREELWMRASRQGDWLRPFAGGSWLVRTTPSVPRGALELGAQVDWRLLFVEVRASYTGTTLGLDGFVGSGNDAAWLGLYASRGADRRGQYLGDTDSAVGLRLAVRPTLGPR